MNTQRGQTLIEILAALSVMAVLLTSITISVLSSLNNATYSKNQNLATQYAQQGMEAVRNLRSVDYTTFNSLSGSYCLAKTCTSLDSSIPSCWTKTSPGACNSNIDSYFAREISAPSSSTDCKSSTKEIQAIVSWTDGRCTAGVNCRQVQVTSCFSNTTTAPAP